MAQNFQNHARFVPAYHFFALPVFLVNFIWHIVQMVRHISFGAVMSCLTAAALVVLAFYTRTFALTVQDRVIRLEMRLRLQQLLAADLRPRIGEFTTAQLVGLRFASDAELPELARKVLDNKLSDRANIKKMVKDWQPDYLRA
ncbi:MAG: DUF6526 family protein [Candidatus Acidiferrales bacterium]